MHDTGTVSQAPAGRSHTAYINVLHMYWQHIICSAGHMGRDVCSLHHDGI